MDLKAYMTSGILELYVLGLASEKERQEVERLIESHPELKHEINVIRKALDEYAQLHGIEPPESVRHNLQKRLDGAPSSSIHVQEPAAVESLSQPATKSFALKWKHLPAIAAILLTILGLWLGLLVFHYRDHLNEAVQKNSELKTQLNHLSASLSSLQKEHSALLEQFSFLSSINTRQLSLNATSKAGDAMVILYWNADQERAFVQWRHLPALPQGMRYRLWAVANKKFEPLADIDSQDSDDKLRQIVFVPNATSFIVTLEKMNGSDYPDLKKMYLQGSMN